MKVRPGTLAIMLTFEALAVILAHLAFSEGRVYPGNSALLGGLLMLIPFMLEMAGLVRLPMFMQGWAFLAVGLHILGLYLGMYDNAWWWDEVTHVISSSMVGMVAALGLFLFDLHSVKIKVPRWAYPLMVVTFSLFIGVVWEIAEFGGDLLAGTRMQYSLSDTLHDCYVDLLGGLITSVLWVTWLWKDPEEELSKAAMPSLVRLFERTFATPQG
ncbi:MAG TPA: hypothetical protein PLJ11_03045 [Methanomassiliicoccales archaeon]|jgi:hypothetical protein|nr:hypothetical protein [Euryarchaeota archaeon]HOO03677.1 hypothetical protein [Methanomassiliicoccales archaeon]HPD09222.1 hypothetical protein [Methanomassiliicoccales archaeon]